MEANNRSSSAFARTWRGNNGGITDGGEEMEEAGPKIDETMEDDAKKPIRTARSIGRRKLNAEVYNKQTN